MPNRRQFVCAMSGIAVAPLIPASALAQADPFAPLIAKFTGGAPVREGRVTVDTPSLADNGNAVPLRIVVDSAMNATDHVQRIVLLSEKNPRPVMATFHLGPHAGRAVVTTRVRLNGAQRLVAVAQMADGTFWTGSASVIVTSTACWDES